MFNQEEVFYSNKSGKWFIAISTLMMTLFLFNDPLRIPSLILWGFYTLSILLLSYSTFEYIQKYIQVFKEIEQK